MASRAWADLARHRPVLLLSVVFVAWKTLILAVACASPGIGYDTSTSLLPAGDDGAPLVSTPPAAIRGAALKLVRWDAVYFTHMATHGHVFEQEWAFGVGWSSILSAAARALSALGLVDAPASELAAGTAGVVVSHVSHFLAVLALWSLAGVVVDGDGDGAAWPVPVGAALLHIISPAGVFLTAPYTEAVFAGLSMAGFAGYARAVRHFQHGRDARGAAWMLLAGLALGTATLVRSNGVLAGIPFLVEAATTAGGVLRHGLTGPRVARLAVAVIGGLAVAAGFAGPQILGYREYCAGRPRGDRRPWCESTIPSIFTFVQCHYWNVGPFRYWELVQVPLFVLAAPTVGLLVYSAVAVLREGWPSVEPESTIGPAPTVAPSTVESSTMASKSTTETRSTPDPPTTPLLRRIDMRCCLALPQLVLAVLAVTSYHVQIITRLSSGCPLWYIWLAAQLSRSPPRAAAAVRWMVVYSLVQAGLFASFLPPA